MKDKESKKLVIISPFQFHLHRGIERYTYSLANALAEKGFRIIIYTWSAKKSNVDWGKWHSNISIRKMPRFRYFESVWAGLNYRAWIRWDNPDFILLNFLYHGEHLLPARRKYFYILHSPSSATVARYIYIKKLLNKFKDLEFVAVSQYVKREAIPFVENRKITVIYGGVDTDLFKPIERPVNTPKETISIVSAVALYKHKGIHYLIHAIQRMNENQRKKIKYDVFGDGPYKSELQNLIQQNNLENIVSLKSPVNNLNDILPQYDLFCLFSLNEALGLSLLEALACGLPLMTSNAPPFDEIVDNKCGKLIDRENAEGIIEFIENFRLQFHKNNWLENARKKALDFKWDQAAEKFTSLLQAHNEKTSLLIVG